MRSRFRFRQTTILIAGCIGFLLGLAVARIGNQLTIAWLLVAIPIAISFYRRKAITTLLSVFLLLFLLGHLRGQIFINNINKYDQLNGQKIQIVATANNDAEYNDKKQLSFDVSKIYVFRPEKLRLVGVIKVSGFGENSIHKGDELLLQGKLFRTRGSRQASISYADIKVVKKDESKINNIRREFSAGISSVLPDPQAPFGLGLLIGQRSTLSEEATKWLAVVGLTHIIAVSGYNLTIIVRFIHRLFARHSRYQTVLFSCVVMGLFLLMTGFSASIVRATIVCGLSLLAWYYGRKFRPLLLILITACITAGWYPVYIWSDVGWYLSFLAFGGVLILAPQITARLFSKKPKPLTSAVIETFSAQIMTLPLILYIFNEASVVALLSNALVVPVVPVAMLFTLFAGLAGMISPQMLNIVALPAKFILSYILGVAQVLSGIPHVLVSAKISLFVMVGLFLTIALMSLVMSRKTRGKRAIITDEVLV